jgi:hypothetical protein
MVLIKKNQMKWSSPMEETIPISKFKATCLRLLDNVKITGDIISPVLDEKEWEVLKS